MGRGRGRKWEVKEREYRKGELEKIPRNKFLVRALRVGLVIPMYSLEQSLPRLQVSRD